MAKRIVNNMDFIKVRYNGVVRASRVGRAKVHNALVFDVYEDWNLVCSFAYEINHSNGKVILSLPKMIKRSNNFALGLDVYFTLMDMINSEAAGKAQAV